MRLAEVAGLALVGVPDGARAAGDGSDDAGGAVAGLAALHRPGLRGRVASSCRGRPAAR